MAAVSLAAMKDALHAWVVKGSGLPEEQVIWTLGGRPPASPYIHITLSTSPVGHDWTRARAATAPLPGADTTVTVTGWRRVTVVMTCFDGDANAGSRSSDSILGDVLTARYLPSVAQALRAASCNAMSVDDIRPIGAMIQSSYFEPRSQLTLRLLRAVELSEDTASIADVEVTQEP